MNTHRVKKTTAVLSTILLYLAGIVFLAISLWPIAAWYLNAVPAIGIDLFNSATFVQYHLEHFAFPWNGFFDQWFGGFPLMLTFPQLSFYLMLPLAAFFGVVKGVQMTSMAALLLMIIIAYFAYSRLARNPVVAVGLAFWVALSANLYGALTWAGSVPSFISQLTFPLALLAGALFVDRITKRRYAAMVAIGGFSILLHPLEGMTFVVPALFVCLISSLIIQRVKLVKSIGLVCCFIIGIIASSLTFTYEVLGSILKTGMPKVVTPEVVKTTPVTQTQIEIAQFYNDQIKLLFSQTHPALFGFLMVAVVLTGIFVLMKGRRRSLAYLTPFVLIAMWTVVHPVLNLSGTVSFLRHEPYRAFWPFPFALAAVVARVVGLIDQKMTPKKWKDTSPVWGFRILLSVVVLFLLFSPKMGNVHTLIGMLTKNVEYSSAFPEAVSIKIKPEEQKELKKQLLPSFIDPGDKNKRLYTSDQTVNIWWNALYDMPLARGYLDPPISTAQRGGFFLLDIAISNDSIVRDFGITEESAYNQALFMIDWYGIHYFEGGVLSTKGPNTPPSTYLVEHDVFDQVEEITVTGAILKWGTASGKAEFHPEIPQNLKYYKINDTLVAPILAPADAPAMAIFSDYAGYEDILRLLAAQNLNSKSVIPVFAGQFIDEFSLEEMKQFTALILHQYKYKNKSKVFANLKAYVEEGGKVYIDNGTELPESDSDLLPDLFPFTKSVRKERGTEWNINEDSKNSILENIDTSDFGPLVYNDVPWKLTAPESNLKEGATAVLRHDDAPILIEYILGKGRVIWSGINLPYHFNQYKKSSEAMLFKNILSSFFPTQAHEWKDAQVHFENPQKVTIKTNNTPGGFLFRQQVYEDWQARLVSDSRKKLKIYRAGPTYPGFMYVMTEPSDKDATLEFVYKPKMAYMVAGVINVGAYVLLLEILITNGWIMRALSSHLKDTSGKRFSSWWEKDDE